MSISTSSLEGRFIVSSRALRPHSKGNRKAIQATCSYTSNRAETLVVLTSHRARVWHHRCSSGCRFKHRSRRGASMVLFATASVVAVHPAGSISPYKSALWQDVFSLMKERLKWEPEPEMQLHVFSADELTESPNGTSHQQQFETVCKTASVFLAVDMKASQKHFLETVKTLQWPAFLVLDSEPGLESLTTVQGLPTKSLPAALVSALAGLPSLLPWAAAASSWSKLYDLWQRRSSDDLAYMLMLAVNDCVAPVPSTQVSMGDAGSLVCMFKNCREQVVACVQDEQCKTALGALSACGLNDQVCSYRVIASYESPLLEAFSKCILQRHNCLGNSAEIPMVPDPTPLSEFRGAALTWEAAEDIFIGHLSPQAPQTSAYDFFPCQFQLWYRAKGKGVMWYDPIFKLETLDGRQVWLRRHYRVRRASVPGSFYFSVLDNGVTSQEYWRIMDCDPNMQWAVFYYSGAASTAGITYRGALICTPSGILPEDSATMQLIDAALERCGVEPWEMFGVNNECCSDAPLSVPDYGLTEWRELTAAGVA